MREQDTRTLEALRKWSVLLDSAFRVPGTRMTFGFDPILGLIPGLGDLTTPVLLGACCSCTPSGCGSRASSSCAC